MRFKSFLLQESVNKTQIKAFKDKISSIIEKEPDEKKMKYGVLLTATSIGSWPILVEKMKEYLSALHFSIEDVEKSLIKSVGTSISIWLKYEKGNAYFYLTSKKNIEPEWIEESEEGSEVEREEA